MINELLVVIASVLAGGWAGWVVWRRTPGENPVAGTTAPKVRRIGPLEGKELRG